MKRGICCECGDTSRSKLSYFCDKCLFKESVERAKSE